MILIKNKLFRALLLSSGASLLYLACLELATGTTRDVYLVWNLALAWIPLGLAYQLGRTLRSHSWHSWRAIIWFMLWLAFLPNSFYIFTDLIHLPRFSSDLLLYEIVVIVSFAINGYILGYLSLYLVHLQMLRLWPAKIAHGTIAVILLLCSFAVPLGRYQRWNTWDIVTQPIPLILDVLDRAFRPWMHIGTTLTTLSFFLLLGSTYYILWQLVVAAQNNKRLSIPSDIIDSKEQG